MIQESRFQYKKPGVYDWALPYLKYFTETQKKYILARNEGLSYEKVGKRFGVSKQAVHILIMPALEKLDYEISIGKIAKKLYKQKKVL